MIHTVKGFSIVNEAKVDVYGETMEIVTDFLFLGSKITAEQFCTEKQPNFNEVNF